MSEKEKDSTKAGVLTTTMEGVEAVSKEEIDKILKKIDKEASARQLTGTAHWIVYVIAVSWSMFQVYTAAFGLLPAQLVIHSVRQPATRSRLPSGTSRAIRRIIRNGRPGSARLNQ